MASSADAPAASSARTAARLLAVVGFAAATKLVEELLDGDATAAKTYGAPNNTDYNLQILDFPQWCGDKEPYFQLALGVSEKNQATGRR